MNGNKRDNRPIGGFFNKNPSFFQKRGLRLSKKDLTLFLLLVKRLFYPRLFLRGRITRLRLFTTFIKARKILSTQIKSACLLASFDGKDLRSQTSQVADKFFRGLAKIRSELDVDASRALSCDPAARSIEEVILCYPGFSAVFTYRIAHLLDSLSVPVIPRLLSEISHSETSIDIHPSASIGEGFFIDHGTGVVIGETTVIGKNVRLYHGVTLGASNLTHPDLVRGKKRHPTLGDGVTVYSGARILGGSTVISAGAVVPSGAYVKDGKWVPPVTRPS